MEQNEATVEIQDEIKEELEHVTEEVEDGLQENQEGQQEEIDQEETPEIDRDDPKFKAGAEFMKTQVQDAFDKRVSKIIGKTKASEMALRDEFTQKLEEFKSSLAPKAEAPKLADFESEEEWASAFFDYKNGVTPKQPKKETTPLGNVSQSQLEFGRKESLYADKHPEYYQNVNVLTPYLKQNPALKDAIFDTDPALADFLSNNLELVDQISTQTPVQIGRSLSIIENKFKRNQPIPKKAKKPAPATEQRGTTSSKDISKMTQSEYNEYMSKI